MCRLSWFRCLFAALLLCFLADGAVGRVPAPTPNPYPAYSVPLLLLQLATTTALAPGAALSCPTNLPTNTIIRTQIVETPITLTNVISVPRPSTNIACTNLSVTNVTVTNVLLIDVILTNVTSSTIVVSNLAVTNVTITPITVTNLVSTNALVTEVIPFLNCVTNLTNNKTSTVSVRRPDRIAPQSRRVPADGTGLGLIPLAATPPVVTNVICNSGFITNTYVTNGFIVDVEATNIAVTNVTFEPVLVTNTTTTTFFLTNTIPTNLFLTNVVLTPYCTTNITTVIDLRTNLILGYVYTTNLITTYTTPAGVRFTAPTWSVLESGMNAVIGVERMGDPNSDVSVTFSTADLTASAGSDYTTTTLTLDFPPGVMRRDVNVPILNDTLPETNETVQLTLSAPVNAVILAPCVAELTIVDDDVSADLVLSKTSLLTTLRLGETNEWRITLRNNGPATATNIVVEDVLPGQANANYSRPSPGTIWADDRQEWRIPSLAPGATSSLVLGFRTISAGTVTNCASIISSQPKDPVTNNNSACATATWINSTNDIAITKEALAGQTNVGGVIPFRITVRNNGPDEARFVNVFDTVPAGAALVGAILPPGTVTSSGTPGAYSLPLLTNGQSVEIIVRLRGDTNAFLTNCASAHGSIADVDRNPTNNQACAGAVWGPSADLEASIVPLPENPPIISQRTDATWDFVVTNRGPDTASNVTLTLRIPDHFRITFQRAAGLDSGYDRATGLWTIRTPLDAGRSASLRLGLMPTNAGPAEFTVEVRTSGVPDPDSIPGNGVPTEDDFARHRFNVAGGFGISGIVEFCDPGSDDAFRPSVEVFARQGTNLVARTIAVSGNNRVRSYALTNLPAGSYRITGTSPGYLVAGPDADLTVGPGVTNPNNIVVEAVIPTFRVQFATCLDQPLPPGVMVQVSGTTNFIVPVGVNGEAIVTNVLIGSNYVFTPSHPWLAFTPKSVTNVARGGRLDCQLRVPFRACPTLTISGRLSACGTNGPAIPLVPILLSTPTNALATNLTAVDGRFSFTNLWPGPYLLSAPTNLVTLTPRSVKVVLGTTPVVTNLVASATSFIAGRVTKNTNTGPAMTNLAVILTGTNGLVRTNFTDTNGFFVFTNLSSGRYVVRPYTNSALYKFVPTNALFNLGSATNCTNFQAFVGLVKRAELVSLEVMQAVQGWENPVSLVVGKPTFVRAHLQPAGTNQAPVAIRGAQLLVKRAGLTLARINPNPGQILARTNAALRRTNIISSLNFPIDTLLTRLGSLTFEFQWTNGILSPREPAGGGDPASNAVVTVQFQRTPVLPVRWVAVDYTNHLVVPNPFGSSITVIITNRPDVTEFPVYQNETLSMYPVSRMDNTRGALRWTNGAPGLRDASTPWTNGLKLWAQLLAFKAADASPNHLFIGVVPAGPFFRNMGLAGAALFQEVGRNDNRRHETGHELGHALGRPHPIRAGVLPNVGGPFAGELVGACGETASPPLADRFPMYRVLDAGPFMPTLGPVPAPTPEQWIFGWYQDRRLLINPLRTFDLMSYCNGETQWKWPSQYNYEALFTAIRATYGIPILPFSIAKLQSAAPSLLVRGTIDLPTGSTDLSPLYILPEPQSAGLPEPGPYTLRLLGPGGAILLDVPFDAPVPVVEQMEDEPALDIATGIFAFRVPFDPLTERVQVLRSGLVVAERIATPSLPAVTLSAPTAGSVYGPQSLSVAWSASDPDADGLSSLVQWSPDGGASWETLAIDQEGPVVEVGWDTLRGTTNAMVRVLTTDGFRTTIAVAGPFEIRGHAPILELRLPFVGEHDAYGQQVEFEAVANDLEDGVLDGDAVVWTSDRDGEIGRGARFSRRAEELSTGRHQIRVVAQDRSGFTVTNTVDLVIASFRSPPMQVHRAGDMVEIRWSLVDEGFVLESASNLSAPDWSATDVEATEEGEEFVLRLPVGSEMRFFRLNRLETE